MTGAPILVGVDGSDTSQYALDLAITEATLRGCSVRAVYADPWADHPAWASQPPDPRSEPELAIEAATRQAKAATVPVTTEILAGDPAPVLIRESGDAALVIVGHRGRGGFPGLLLGSVAAKVAAHGKCPVVVTRGAPRTDVADIVVGVDGTPANQAAIGFAFAEAALHATRVVAVHVWNGPDLTGLTDLLIENPAAELRNQEALLDDALALWVQRYPSVPVQRNVAVGRPSHTLVDAGQAAYLLVLGAHASGLLPGTRLGTVSHTVLHHAPCAVVVAR